MPTTRFSKLQVTRPPTPPLEHGDFDLDACQTGLELLDSKDLIFNTPNDSPNPTCDTALKSSAERSAKRVGFVLRTGCVDEAKSPSSSSAQSKPKRSILKPSIATPSSIPSGGVLSPSQKSFAAMLEHLVKGLASQDVSARYDAYMSINGCLKTYTDVPSRKSLVMNMPVLDNYIRRDLVLDGAAGVRASQTTTEALKFVTQLCWFPETRSAMTAGFQVFLLNHAITILGKEDTPKTIANLYLYLLSVQRFPPRVVNNEKVSRILSTVRGTAARVQGRQASAHRLAIYRRLIEQAKGLMAAKASLWMEDLLDNMLSQDKVSRERAISLGFIAGQRFASGADVAVADAAQKVMNKKSQTNEAKYIHHMIRRLKGWLDAKQDTLDIPAIWSIVILLLNTRPNQAKQWEHFSPWLQLIQGCLNINDSKTRKEANLAWMRFIYVISPGANTAKSFSNLLFRPTKRQLERQEREKDSGVELWRHVDSTYMTLLYYAFRPGTEFEVLDRYWHEYIVPVFASEKGLLIDGLLARQLLIALLGCGPRPWQAERALETASLLTAGELPRLDCKWIRSRARLIIDILERHIPGLDPENSSDQDSWKNVWTVFLDAIKLAGLKEIKVAPETTTAMAELLNVFRRSARSSNLCELPQGVWIISYAYRQLGIHPFLDERIIDGGEHVRLSALSASADRSKRSVVSPLQILTRTMLRSVEVASWQNVGSMPGPLQELLSEHFPTAVALLQAGYKQLPVHIRHNSATTKYSGILDELQRATPKSGDSLEHSCQQLYAFTRWMENGVLETATLPCNANRRTNVSKDIVEKSTKDEIIVPRTTSADNSSIPLPQAETTGTVVDQSPSMTSKQEKAVTTPEVHPNSRRSGLLQQQPRLRHDNSQIEFAMIDSSPSILKAFDSQLLTERQREVKERQNGETGGLFRDISSSTGRKPRTESTPRLQLSGRDRAKIGQERYGSSSPLAAPDDSLAALFGSSPTPNSRRPSTKNNADDTSKAAAQPADTSSAPYFGLNEPPSSPPAEALKVLQGFNVATTKPVIPASTEEDNEHNGMNSTEDAVATRDELPAINHALPRQDNALPLNFLSSAAIEGVAEEIRAAQRQDYLVEEQRQQRSQSPSSARETDAVVTLDEPSDSEDEELLCSQIDQDLKRASQDATVFVDSPRKVRYDEPHKAMLTPKRSSPAPEKRTSPEYDDDADHLDNEPPRKRSKITREIEVDGSKATLVSLDLISDLQMLLDRARSGFDAQQGLAILQMSAELTQLAVKAIQG